MQPHDSLLSQAYREAVHPEPSPALDERILAAARQAVVPQRRRPAWFGWAVPLSTMAVLVLGIGLLFRMQLEAPETLREDMAPLPALESNASREAGPGVSSAASPAPAPDARSAAPPARAKLEDMADQTQTAPIQRPAPTVAAAAPESAANKAEHATVAGAPAAAEVGAAIAPMPEAPVAAAGANLAKEYLIRAEREASAQTVHPSAAPLSAARLKQDNSRMQLAAPMAESPEQWVESIRKLLREGQIEAARIRLQELRKRFPDFPLPPDLETSRCCPLPATSAE